MAKPHGSLVYKLTIFQSNKLCFGRTLMSWRTDRHDRLAETLGKIIKQTQIHDQPNNNLFSN